MEKGDLKMDRYAMNRYTEETLAAAREVEPSFKYVKIDRRRLQEVAEENADKVSSDLPAWDCPLVQPAAHHAFPSQEAFGNAINFDYDKSIDGKLVKFEVPHPDPGKKPFMGAYAMQRCIYRLAEEKPLTVERMRSVLVDFETFRAAFRGTNEMPLLEERYDMLHEVCNVLATKFAGDIMQLIKRADYRAFGDEKTPGIVELLVKEFPLAFGEDHFKDEHCFFVPHGRKFVFNKRAQLFALMYHDRAVNSGDALRPLRDPESIGPIADYELPKSYVADGVLVYNETLSNHIANALEIRSHMQPEIEIRLAFTLVHTEELHIMNRIRKTRGLPPIHVGHLDYYRWERGRAAKHLNHHLTHTTDY